VHLRQPSSQRSRRSLRKSQRSVRSPVGARSRAARSRARPANSRKCPPAAADRQARHKPGTPGWRRRRAWPPPRHRWATSQSDSPPASELPVDAEAISPCSPVSSDFKTSRSDDHCSRVPVALDLRAYSRREGFVATTGSMIQEKRRGRPSPDRSSRRRRKTSRSKWRAMGSQRM
jgi:hypothetical protein